MNIVNLRFLVVEDQSFQRWVLGNLLQRLGARFVFSAPDGQAALDFVRTADEPFDIVVSDLDMPGMDGMEFIRHLVSESPAVSLIIVSGMGRPLVSTVETMARAYGTNVLGAIEKPATAKKMESMIRLHTARPGAVARPAARIFGIDEILEGIRNIEFEPFFQPKVELETRAIRGAEALARWRHPQLGLISPKGFIAPLEAGGKMDGLTMAMVEGAARNCRRWIDASIDASVSVNLSLGSLADVTLANRVTDVVEAQGLEPRRVTFEITESAAVSDVGKTLENLSRLRMKGFGLSIDDYGTGYSSMERLARVPFTELKIDRSFVGRALTEPASRAVLESSLEMARKLGIGAVAEGVESESEWNLLKEMGCSLAQGYFVARPMGAAEFLAWARAAGSPR
jgi:EAL domain-containing protein (putative c-di-GMP-specific phosphodiesterase class I)/CheY-like chemotaxis protein